MIAKVIITVVALSIIVVNFNSEGGGGGGTTFALSTKLVNKSTRSPADTSILAQRISSNNIVALSSTTEKTTNTNSLTDISVLRTTNDTPPSDISDEEANVSGVELYSVDVRYDLRSPFIYDTTKGRYVSQAVSSDERIRVATTTTTTTNERSSNAALFQRWKQFLTSSFVPEGVSESYFDYVRWRVLQRFVNANVHVIGTQSLLMGLRGMQQQSRLAATTASGGGGAAALGAAAATNWVLKDTLGKVVRMAWASRMGRKFDPDAKRWRFRASLIYAIGNGLEVCTYLRPRYFLVLAMLANSCKQMSMLTSSATRNAIYNSFRRVDNEMSAPPPPPPSGGIAALPSGANGRGAVVSGRRGSGGVENIGDITAKGEAQIAVVDLMGIASGICLTRAVGVSVQNVLSVWIILQIAEIFCMYHEMRSVVYKTFNFERMYTVLGDLMLEEGGVYDENEETIQQQQHLLASDQTQTPYKFKGRIPTPRQIAMKEKIFLPPDHLARRAIAFGSPGRTLLDPDELDMLIKDVFRGEKYFLVVGQDVKNERGLSSKVRQWMRRRNEVKDCSVNKDCNHVDLGIDPQEQCHIVLHADANNLDILKSALALVILRKKLVKKVKGWQTLSSSSSNTRSIVNGASADILRSRECMTELRAAMMEANEIFPGFLRELTRQGWRPPLRSMLGRVSARADWQIQRR
jgi:hypothetical protein